MKTAAIIVAAGRGSRAGGGVPKQWRPLAGRPVARWTLEAFAPFGPMVLVIHPDDRPEAEAAAQGLPDYCLSTDSSLVSAVFNQPQGVSRGYS